MFNKAGLKILFDIELGEHSTQIKQKQVSGNSKQVGTNVTHDIVCSKHSRLYDLLLSCSWYCYITWPLKILFMSNQAEWVVQVRDMVVISFEICFTMHETSVIQHNLWDRTEKRLSGVLCQFWDLILVCFLQETLSERLQRKAIESASSVAKRFALYLLAWTLCVSLAIGSCAAIYFLQLHQSDLVRFPFIFRPHTLKNSMWECNGHILYSTEESFLLR